MKTLTQVTCLAFALFALSAAVLFGPAQSGSAQAPTPTPSPCPHCTQTPFPTNIPLNDLGQRFYSNPSATPGTTPVQGGLYPGGYNQRPADHNTDGLRIAQNRIVPISRNGTPDPHNTDPDSKIVMISIGMCNTTKEFGGDLGIGRQYGFVGRTMGDPDHPEIVTNWRNPKLFVVDCAQSGQDGYKWATNSLPPPSPTPSCTPSHGGPSCTPNPWLECFERLVSASPTPYSTSQVQVIWLKEALIAPEASPYGVWPKHAQDLQGYLETILNKSVEFFPNAQMAFLSPRTRAWTLDGQNFHHSPEPDAYETGFADQWVIADQINGGLNYKQGHGPVVSPWLSWGPYLWTDGLTPRSDGLTWLCSYVVTDCVHPTVDGVTKVVDQLLAFFKTDPVATPWFLKRPDHSGDRPTFNPIPTPTAVPAGASVHFHVSAIAHATPNPTIAEYVWTFDDGDYAYDTGHQPQTDVDKTFPASSQTGNPYQVHVTAIDAAGNAGFATIPVTVTTPTPTP